MALHEIEAFLNSIEITTFETGAEYWVDITHIVNPHEFYTRLTTHRKVVDKIKRFNPVAKPTSVSVCDIVLFNLRSPDNPKYVRGKVTLVKQADETTTVNIFAIDYGFEEKNVTFDRIWTCEKSIMKIPPLAMKCRLDNCAPRNEDGSWGDAIETFKFFVGKECFKMIVKDITGPNLVVALNNPIADDMATMLILTGCTTLGYVHNAGNSLQPIIDMKPNTTIPKYEYKKLSVRETIYVRVISGKTLQAFYVADVIDYKKFVDERRNLVIKEPPLIDTMSVSSGDLVCVWDRHDRYYKRAIIEKIISGKAQLRFVDTGKKETMAFCWLHKIPEECLSIPVVGIFCSLVESQINMVYYGGGAYYDEKIARLLHPGREYHITVVKSGQDHKSPYIVKINDIEKYLSDK